MQTHEGEEATKVFKDATYAERLAIASYLIWTAYRIAQEDEMKMDRTAFETRKR